MAALARISSENEVVRTVCGIVLRGHWDNILKQKIGSCVTSTTIDQALVSLSSYGFSLSWSFFKWVESIPSYKPSLHSSWTMICILTKQKHFKTAQSMLEKIALKDFLSSPTVLNALVSKCDQPEVNSHVLSWLIIFYAKSKMIQDAVQVFDHMRVCGFKPHLHACTVLLNSLVRDGLCHTMWKVYKKMIKVGVVPNLHIYNVLIHGCCKSGDVEKAEELWSEMELKSVFPDLITYNTLISLYCKRGMHYEALSVQDRMERGGVCPDIVTYNSLIYSYCREGRMREALRLFKEIKGANPNQVTYTTLIDGYCRANDLDEALRLRDAMEVKGLYPGIVTYNSILRKLCEEGRLRDANKLLNEMSSKKIEPDNITCNTLINAYCKIGDMISALKVRAKMLESGLKPDPFTFNALIHGFCKARDVKNAKDMIFEMITAGFFPSSCIFSWLVGLYCDQGNEEAVAELPDEFWDRGLCTDISFYRAIIRSLCKREKIDCAQRIFVSMNGKGISGDCVVYTSLAYAYFKVGDSAAAAVLLDEMDKKRLMVTVKVYKSFNASFSNDSSLLDIFWGNLVQRGLMSKTTCNHIQ